MNFDPMAGTRQLTNKLWEQQQEMFKNVAEGNKRKEEREEEKIQLLREIKESNFQVVELVRKNNEINKELFDLFQELNTIMVAQNEEEAQGIFQKVMGKATLLNEGADTIKGLYEHGKMLITIIKQQYLG